MLTIVICLVKSNCFYIDFKSYSLPPKNVQKAQAKGKAEVYAGQIVKKKCPLHVRSFIKRTSALRGNLRKLLGISSDKRLQEFSSFVDRLVYILPSYTSYQDKIEKFHSYFHRRTACKIHYLISWSKFLQAFLGNRLQNTERSNYFL